jgi:hypothetical protein
MNDWSIGAAVATGLILAVVASCLVAALLPW